MSKLKHKVPSTRRKKTSTKPPPAALAVVSNPGRLRRLMRQLPAASTRTAITQAAQDLLQSP